MRFRSLCLPSATAGGRAKTPVLALLGALLVSAWAIPVHAACTTVGGCASAPTNLGTFPGGSDSEAFAISTDGSTVVGYAGYGNFVGAFSAFRWTGSGALQNIASTISGESQAWAVSADGSVVAGYGFFTGGRYHAFRWSAADGVTDLGTIGGNNSQAFGVSGNGQVIVGESTVTGINDFHAFRWTAAGGMTDLGTLGGAYSTARAVNADGSVVVGSAALANFVQHAFRWTSSGGMADLGTLGGNYSAAYAVTPDGTVVAGGSTLDANGFLYHAFRWTAQTGMQDLDPTGTAGSEARGISANGAIIVGNVFNTDRAFRWTSGTGIKDLTGLLVTAGVDMTGIVLRRANGISGDGRFIVGTASFNGQSGGQIAYIVRYEDGPDQTAPVGGMTSAESVARSITGLANSLHGAAAQQHGLAAPLLGGDNTQQETSEVGAFGSLGSVTVGVTGRYVFGNGLALFGGLAFSREDYDAAALDGAKTLALGARYALPRLGAWRPFVEAGGWIAPGAALALTRRYDNGAGTAVATTATRTDMSYVYGRFGVGLDLGPRQLLTLSGELGREHLHTAAYAETFSAGNPFEAHVGAGQLMLDLAKIKLQYGFALSRRVDAAFWGAAVRSVNVTSDVVATVTGVGTFAADALPQSTWGEFGARIGYKWSETVTLDVSTAGVTGGDLVGTRFHTGAGIRLSF